MSAHTNEQIVRDLFDAISGGDRDGLGRVLAKECPVYGHGKIESEDVDGYWDSVRYLRTAFPDFNVRVEEIIECGDRTATRVTASGTHQGEFEGIAPTGRSVEFASIAIHRLADRRIIEEHYVADFAGLMHQPSDDPT